MPKSERDDLLNELASRLLSSMVEDLVLDATMQSHQEIARSRAICPVCHTRCAAVHVPGPSNVSSQSAAGSSRAATPMSVDAKPGNGSDNGSNTPTNTKTDGVINLECMNCDRQIAFNRYANHLSSCMGINGSSRRGSARTTNNVKTKFGEAGRSASPTSDLGNLSDDSKKSLKGKLKSKSKRDDEAEFNLKRKRLTSPQVSPVKKQKKKPSGSPVSRLKSDLDNSGLPSNAPSLPSTNTISRVPSKLRESSTTSFLERSPSTPSSRSISPGVASVATVATSSSFSGPAQSHSPTFAGKGLMYNKPVKKVTGTGPPRRLSPPRPRPPPVQLDYTIDVEGEETGSSTDTDSS